MVEFDDKSEPFLFDGSKEHGLLLIHGFTGSPANVRLMGEYLHQKTGYTVKGIRLRGHATSMKDLNCHPTKDWIDDADDGYKSLKKECKKVSIIGHSMGGFSVYLPLQFRM